MRVDHALTLRLLGFRSTAEYICTSISLQQ